MCTHRSASDGGRPSGGLIERAAAESVRDAVGSRVERSPVQSQIEILLDISEFKTENSTNKLDNEIALSSLEAHTVIQFG